MGLTFKQFLLQVEMNVPGYHNDGNRDSSGGGYLDSQQTGSEMSGGNANLDNSGLSLHSTELSLPVKISHETIGKVDKKNLTISFAGGGGVKFKTHEMWMHYMKGKEPEPGDKADVEYWTNRHDDSDQMQHIAAVHVR